MSDPAISPDIQRLLERLDEEESLELEFKAARGGLPVAIWPTLSAFANTVGGWIVLGVVEDERGSLAVDGVPNPAQILGQLHSQLRNPQKISHPVCGTDDVRIEDVGQSKVLLLRVPPAIRSNRPIYLNNNPYGATYVRRHSGDYACTRDEVNRMMREASDLPADRVVLDAYGWEDLDRDAFRRYRQRFQTRDPGSAWIGYTDDEFLRAIGGYRHDRETSRQGITVAGLLMFGTGDAIREWRSRHLIDFRLVSDEPGATNSVDWTDRITWEGHLFGAFETLYPKLTAGLPAPLRFEGGWRVGETPWHLALREALVNLLVHADYRERAASLILRSDRGCVFRNPGSSRVADLGPVKRDDSDPRNDDIVRMFRLIGLAEEAGSGVPRIFAAWRDLGFLPPEIDAGGDRYEFSIDLRYAHLLSDEDRRWLVALGGPWSEPEQLALVVAKHEGGIDNGTLRSITGLHPTDATKTLGGLRDQGLLRMTGAGRGAKYQIDPAALSLPGSAPVDGDALDGDGGATTVPTVPSTAHSAGSTAHSASTAFLERPTPEADRAPFDDPLWVTLEAIARPVASTDYVAARQRDDVIVALCEVRPLSLVEIMWLVNRDKAYLRTILRQLVDNGRLRYLHESPRHPAQRYVALSNPAPTS